MRSSDLAGKRIGIWGFGREGRSTLRWLRARFPDQPVVIANDTPLPEAALAEIAESGRVILRIGGDAPAALAGLDIVVKAPGISLYRPEIAAARAAGTVVTSATNLWFAEHAEARVVAVTGTKGKSTTASLLAHLLRAAGLPAMLGGNIGVPILGLAQADHAADPWILELSSYQTADLAYAPTLAVLTALFPEHVDWHGSTEAYYRDKLNLFKPGSGCIAVLNHDDPNTRRLTAAWRDVVWFNRPDGLHIDGNAVFDGGMRLCAASDLALPGRHNLSNLCAALAAAKALGADPARCVSALSDFHGLPHRLQVLGERDGITFVNDSISTTPESAMAALQAFADRTVTLILGGYDRRQDYRALADAVVAAPVAVVVTVPANGPRIAEALRRVIIARAAADPPRIVEAADLAEAVERARALTPPGGAVLLSPAAPSYGGFHDFEERGRVFAALAGFAEPE